MNRRSFLQRAFYTYSGVCFGQYLLSAATVFADPLPPTASRIVNIRQSFLGNQPGYQNYFRLLIDLAKRCEVTTTRNEKYIQMIIKNCRAEQFAGAFACRNAFTKKYEVRQINGTDVQIRVYSIKVVPVSEFRCSILPPGSFTSCYRILLDIGAFSKPTALKEEDLGIVETNLKFGPLQQRPETNLLVVHHVGCTNRDVSAAEIHKWHLANGWAGIGYHYVIRKNGSIERGRPRDDIGAHTYGFNETSIGINVVGDFEIASPEEAQLKSAARLIAALCNMYNLPPTGSVVLGHRDLNDTLCPGKNLYNQLEEIKLAALFHMKNA
jgi:hypothetical protein